VAVNRERHPIGEEWVDPVFGLVRRIPKPTPWERPAGTWFMKEEDQIAIRRRLGEALRAAAQPPVTAESKKHVMAIFYHVGKPGLATWTVLQPGSWGRTTRQFGPSGRPLTDLGDANVLMWEIALETARFLSAPDSPSRFECVFTCETMADAIAFRDRFKKGSAVYEVECDDGVPRHLGNFEAITYHSSTAPHSRSQGLACHQLLARSANRHQGNSDWRAGQDHSSGRVR
jgi:hypothetical protein